MRTPDKRGGLAKVSGFLLVLLVVFGAALVAGNAVGPVAETPAVAQDDRHGDGHDDGHDHEQGETRRAPQAASTRDDAADIPGGVMVSQNGYTVSLTTPTATPGTAVPVSFAIAGPDGKPVTTYDVAHEKELHLIAVRRDFTGFQHVHPVRDPSGLWTTSLGLTAGPWRLFADFTPTGADPVTLGADLNVSGTYQPAPPGMDSRTARVAGYTVGLAGALMPGTDARLRLSVERDGRPVTDLQPYLGAYGHLIALRGGDLAYLHVHPDGVPDDGKTKPGPHVVFYAAVPSAGTYHLYLDFKHGGVVRTAAFTLTTSGANDSEQHTGAHTTSRSTTPRSGQPEHAGN